MQPCGCASGWFGTLAGMSDRFDFQQHENGQIYISEGREQMLHATLRGPHDTEIQIGHDGRVEIDKLYGPLVFWPIRATIDLDACEWVVERLSGGDDAWHEVARIPGQMASDYPDDDAA